MNAQPAMNTTSQFAVTLDSQAPDPVHRPGSLWPLSAADAASARCEYAADALKFDLPDPAKVALWQRTITVATTPWQMM